MPIDSLVLDILDQVQSGLTPEEACAGRPELLDEVRERLARLNRIRAELDDVFPEPGLIRGDGGPPPDPAHLPEIPGHVVESVLGRGGMGVVYKARHLRFNRPVAVKMMLAGGYAGPPELARFFREAEALAGLTHPNVVQVHEVGDLDGLPYYTMEFVEGGDLARALAGLPQQAQRAASLVALLAGAVEAAHRGGIVHRDLKPGNVLLTDDGTPKITDFGLAHRFDLGEGLTRTGTRIGTPCYMAPEQADGRLGEVGPATDVYALGAILYEMLTGRPPFKGKSASEIERQVISDQPVPPSKLNPKVSRDLETICLKCLQKDQRDRYTSAKDLEDDLNRFRQGEPIAARPVGWLERTAKAARRRPGLALAAGGSLVLALAMCAGALALAWEHAAKERARRQLAELDQIRLDREFVAKLDAIRLNRPSVVGNLLDWHANRDRADRDYEAAFRQAGYARAGEKPERVASRVAASRIRDELVTALDDWSLCVEASPDRHRRDWVLEVARRAGRDPTGLRERLLDPKVRNDRKALVRISIEALASQASVQLLVSIGERLMFTEEDSAPFLKQVQQRYPGDFWANFILGVTVLKTNREPSDVARYFQAALAIRPDSAMPHCHMGGILGKLGRHEEAASYLRRAIDLDPTQAYAYTLLEHSLAALGKHEESLEVLRKGVRSATNPAPVYIALGRALTNLGRSAEAVEPFRKAVELEPNSPMSHTLLGHALNATRKTDGAIAHYRQAIRLDPNMPEPYNNLAQVLSLQGHGEEAILYLQQAIRLNPSFAIAHSNLCSVLHNAGWLREAIAHGRQAVRLNPRLAATHHNLGIALASAGHLDEAIQHLREAVNLQPSTAEAHSSLSLALYESGRWAETRDTAGRGLALLPRGSAYGEGMTRRKAKSENFLRLEGRLPAVLRGEEAPKNAAEALDFAHICHATGQYAAAATLYTSAFSADPGLPERVAEGQRFRAACSAVLAANDPGKPGKSPTDAERAKLREQALAWLQVDRNAWRAGLEDREPSTRAGAVAGLRRWCGNERLASVRDESALARLPEGERQSWRTFWASIGELAAGDLAAPLDRARAFASRSDWTRAASQYARHFELFPADDGELWFEYAAVQWLLGDAPGYRKACAHMLDRCQQGSPSIRPYHAARACTLAPGLAGEVARANEYANRELLAFASDFWSLTEQGALAQRAGHPSEAIPLLEKSLRANDRPGAAILDWLWLALAYRSLHAEDQARPWVSRAEEWLKLQGDAMPANAGDMDLHFHNWLEAQVLSRELAGQGK